MCVRGGGEGVYLIEPLPNCAFVGRWPAICCTRWGYISWVATLLEERGSRGGGSVASNKVALKMLGLDSKLNFINKCENGNF